ncbi:MAG: hypothetical protein Q8L86_03935 [Vicinamibacterales bacterium]|nr:hypothetical protein [Vicinamibacterales bacterium]
MTSPVLDLIDRVGSDAYLSASELDAGAPSATWLDRAWRLYEEEHDGFVGATLDPLCWRLEAPAVAIGRPDFDGRSVLVVGTGPSLGAQAPQLVAHRDRLCLVTSPRGAELLGDHGLAPDLVIVEHQAPVDARLSTRHVADRGGHNPLAGVPLVAITPHTPAALLGGVDPGRVFVLDPAPTWGNWIATAVAAAARGGAARVGLVGIDLGRPHQPDPSAAATIRLLSLVADAMTIPCVDCGTGAFKEGWGRGTIDDFAGRCARPLTITTTGHVDVRTRRDAVADGLSRLQPVIAWARGERAVAEAARDGRAWPLEGPLMEIAAELDRLGVRPTRRRDIQETLGVAFAPRLWRTGVDAALGPALWRPVLLALDEMVRQADHVTRAVARRAHAC